MRRRRGRNVLASEDINYKNVDKLRRFVSERGKIVSGRRFGLTAKDQRRLAREIKRARHMALLPLAPNHSLITGTVQSTNLSVGEAENSEATDSSEASDEQRVEDAVTTTEASSESSEESQVAEDSTPSQTYEATTDDADTESEIED